jgi:hypothetical protein
MAETTVREIKRKWSSAAVVVSLATVGVALSGCEDGGGDRRNQYETRAQCEADYSAKECEQQARSGGGGFFFLGPLYGGNWRGQPAGSFASGGGPGRAAMASPDGVVARTTQTSRGGFGNTGRSYSSRGS